MKIPVVKTNNFIIYLEDNQGVPFIHCDVLTKWSKEVKQELQRAFKTLTDNWDNKLFALHCPTDKKHEKFLNMFGFKFLNSVKGLDNNDYDVYVWR